MSLTILLLMASALLIVFAFGLTASVHDALYLLRRPGALVRAILAMGVLMPMFAIAVVSIFDLDPAVKIALVALSVSPIIPILPTKLMKAGAAASYAMGLLVAAGVLAIVLVPVAMEILGLVFNLPLQMPVASVATLTFITLLLPFGLGVAVHHFLPGLAKALARPISQIAGITVVVFFFAVFFSAAPAIWTLVGNGTVIALAAFVLVGQAIGHFIGGPEPENRAGLALSTGSRHPGVALAIAQVNFPDQTLATAAVLLYLFVTALVSIPYLRWAKHRRPTPGAPGDGSYQPASK